MTRKNGLNPKEGQDRRLRREELISFYWSKGHGLSWVQAVEESQPQEGTRREGWWLMDRGGGRGYEPLNEEPALFQRFAEVEETMEGISAFATRYGLLGVPAWIADDDVLVGGEWLDEWRKEIQDMRNALAVWEAVKRGRGAERWIKLDTASKDKQGEKRRAIYVVEEKRLLKTITGEKTRPELWPFLLDEKKRAAVQLAALFHVQTEINPKLKENASPKLLYNPDRRHVELHLTPHNLLGAMWMQFARAVEGEKDYRRCRRCREWFEVSLDGRQKKAIYCSDRCRVSAHRQKKAEAVERAAAGEEQLAEIARDLDTDVKTVSSWVKDSKGTPPRRRRTTRGGKK